MRIPRIPRTICESRRSGTANGEAAAAREISPEIVHAGGRHCRASRKAAPWANSGFSRLLFSICFLNTLESGVRAHLLVGIGSPLCAMCLL
jgi:hypothetical protein